MMETPAVADRHPQVAWLAVALAAVAVVLGVVAVMRSGTGRNVEQLPVKATSTTASPSTPIAADVTAARRQACSVGTGATRTIARERHLFLDAPPRWDDPATVEALTRIQAAAAIELDALRQAIGPATPPDIAAAIGGYISGVVDMLDADTRQLPAEISNAASDRAALASKQIDELCKGVAR